MLKHGDCTRAKRTRLHNIWQGMRQRCNNPNNDSYPYYGALSVSICNEWDKYQGFKDWALSSGYASHLTLDRFPNINGDYEPNNCRWATKTAQSRNRKEAVNCTSKYRGVTWNKANQKWQAQITVKNKNQYLGQYLDETSAAKARDNYIKKHKLTHFIMNF